MCDFIYYSGNLNGEDLNSLMSKKEVEEKKELIKIEAPPRLELGLEDLESFVLPLHHRAASANGGTSYPF